MLKIFLSILFVTLLMLAPRPAGAQIPPPIPVGSLQASDTPSDEGGSVDLRWEAEADVPVIILRSGEKSGTYEKVGEADAADEAYGDVTVERNTAYYYKLGYAVGGDTVFSQIAGPVVPKGNWFRHGRKNTLVTTILMFALVVGYVAVARKGRDLYIRKIAGLSAVDEAVGRATEMGKKILFIPGILSLSEIQTIAALSIMKHVSKLTAQYGTDIEVPNKDPLVFSAARETVRQAYLEAGKPDQFREEMVTYITYDQFAYAGSVTAKMVREKPATNFLIGAFFAESLILAETGQAAGSIQIAGTAAIPQLPFFVTTCDYTLLGEELYAASAYLSREPVLLGSIKAQDVAKAILMAVMGAGIVVLAAGSDYIVRLLTTN